jgi:lysozyme
MTLSKEGLAFIIYFEGMCSTPYLDDYPKGEWTIGIGITKYDGLNVKNLPRDKEMSIEEMIAQFKDRIKKYEDDVNRIIKQPMSQQEFDAFVSFHYNTGALGRSTAAKLFKDNKSKNSVVAALQLYNRDGGRVVQGLVRRRREESEIFIHGVYAGNGNASLTKADSKGRQLLKQAKTIYIMPYL